MKRGRKRVKLLSDIFTLTLRAPLVPFLFLNYESVDLLLACLVFKPFSLCYLSAVSSSEVALLLFCTATFYREAFEKEMRIRFMV